ncbi:MAG: HAD-IA family hydrolase [Pseudolabrys sp.]|nr:HAD-IA family hydrolase [Pseudolabrys sp.]
MKLILFDVDGTLMDSQHMICAAMELAYRGQGLACPPPAAVRAIIGLSLRNAMEQLAAGRDHPIDGLVASYKEAFSTMRQAGDWKAPLYPGARQAIDSLRGRPDVVLGVATGKSRRGVAAMIETHAFDGVFATIQTADTAPSKPHPGMVLDAMRETGIAPEDTVVVGDTVFDMQMAKSAGASALGVSWGYHPVADLHGAGALAVLDDFAALDPALAALWPAAPGRAIHAKGDASHA